MSIRSEAELASEALDQAANDLAMLLQSVELAAWAPVVAWTEEANLSLEDVRVLVALDAQPFAAATALDIADATGLSLDTVYRLVPSLRISGYLSEEYDLYTLTEMGDLALEAIEGARRAGIRAYMRGLAPAERLLLEFFART
jgi:DNA-binding MarR family transcriptional regulator